MPWLSSFIKIKLTTAATAIKEGGAAMIAGYFV
jgi:hypothetical protein